MITIKDTSISTVVYLSLILVLLFLNGMLFNGYTNNDLISAPHDVDKTPDGKVFICTTTFSEMLNHNNRVDLQESVNPENTLHKVVEVDEKGRTIWEFTGLAYPHEVEILPNGHLLIADTGFNRVIEVNYPNKEIIWSWEPAKLNWTKVNSEWDAGHYYNNEITYDWTHLNDVDFKQYANYNACLISLRNFDLIVEVNFTAEKIGPANNPANIIWWFGDNGNLSMLHKQHNPDYLSNGNIIIADSLNNRIIEVNKESKSIIWQYNVNMLWPRDADELADGSLLITDSFNCRVFILNKVTNEITWQFKRNLIIPYEADQLDNGNILISGEYAGIIYEVDSQGRIIWRYGASYERSFVTLNSIFLIMISLFGASMNYKKIRRGDISKLQKALNIGMLALFIMIILLGAFLLFGYSTIISAITRWVYPKIGAGMF